MMRHQYSYQEVLEESAEARWRVEDLIGGDQRLDFEQAFLPESLAGTMALEFLSPSEQRTLNQIRAYGYLSLYELAEQFILPFVLDHARQHLGGDHTQVRALLSFAAEEAKHVELFRRFREEFVRGFGAVPASLAGHKEFVRAVLSRHPLAVALSVLHAEWMTQTHYEESIHHEGALDPVFKNLLRQHWLEEAQHTKIDSLILESIADVCSESEITEAVEEYVRAIRIFDETLRGQVALDRRTFENVTGRSLTLDEAFAFQAVQERALRWTFIGSGLSNENILNAIGRLGAAHRARVERVAPAFR